MSHVLVPRTHGPVRRVLTALVAGGVLVTSGGAAWADSIYNTLDGSIDSDAEAMSITAGGADGTTKLKVNKDNTDGTSGCQITGQKTLKIELKSSNAGVATVSPQYVEFTSCSTEPTVTVTGVKKGDATVTATEVVNTTGEVFALAPVTFIVNVAAATTTTTTAAPSDTTPPGAPTIDLVAASDTGSSDTDDHTGDTTPTLTGTAEAASTVEVFDGTTSLGTTTATSAGQWTFTPSTGLTNGSHSFTAKATDAASNVSAASSALSVTIDASVPAVPTIDLVAGSDTGASSTDNVTSDNTPTLSGSAEAGSAVSVFDGTTLLKTVTATAEGTWTATTEALANGTHTLTSQATDRAGNTSAASLTLEVETDTVKPGAPTIDLADDSDSGASNSDNVTNETALVLNGTAEAGSTVQVFNGTAALGSAVTAGGTGAWTFTTPALPGGVHELTAVATDTSGNVSVASVAVSVTVDGVAPAKPTINLVDASDTGASQTDNITGDSTPTLDGQAEAGSTVRIYDGATLLETVTAVAGGTWNSTVGRALSDGVHTLTLRATDAAGNTSEASLTLEVETDTVKPGAPTIDLADASDSGASNSDNVTNETALVLNGTAEAGSTVRLFDGTNPAAIGTVTAGSGGAWSFTSAALPQGGHALTAKAEDASGNVSDPSAALSVLIDTEAPVVERAGSVQTPTRRVGSRPT